MFTTFARTRSVRLALALATVLMTSPSLALINDKGELIDSQRNLQEAQCWKLAKQAVKSGFRKVQAPAKKFTYAEYKAGCPDTLVHMRFNTTERLTGSCAPGETLCPYYDRRH